MEDPKEAETKEFITDLPVADNEADQTHGGSETIPFAGQTIRLRIATTNNRGQL